MYFSTVSCTSKYFVADNNLGSFFLLPVKETEIFRVHGAEAHVFERYSVVKYFSLFVSTEVMDLQINRNAIFPWGQTSETEFFFKIAKLDEPIENDQTTGWWINNTASIA